MPNTNAAQVMARVQQFAQAQRIMSPGWNQFAMSRYGDNVRLASPDAADWHVTQLLEEVSLAYRPQRFIAEQVMPVVRVTSPMNSIREYNRDDWNRIQADVRGQNDRGPRGGYTIGTQTYECVEYSMSTDVTDKDRKVVSGSDDPDESAVEWCTDQVLLLEEWLVATILFSSGNYASGNYETLSGTDQWSDAGSDPIGEVTDAMATVKPKLGTQPNQLVLGPNTWRKLRNHPQLVTHNAAGMRVRATLQQAAELFEVERILVGDATRTTSQEGAAADTYSEIWGNHAALNYAPSNPGLLTMTYGYLLIDQDVDHVVDGWRNGDGATSDATRVRLAFDAKVLANFAGYLWTNAVA